MNWREIGVTVSSAGEEAVADLFYQLGCPGVSIEDPELLRSYVESGTWDYHDFGEVALTGTSVVKGYICEDEELQAKLRQLDEGLKELLRSFPDWVLQVKGLTVQEEDWATSWKAYFKPTRIGQRFLIKPTWEDVVPIPTDIILELDPGMAFGTGTHATTSLCLEALEEIVRPRTRVFDLGTGSGILAIAAAKLGAQVEAIDLDSVAVKVAQENVELNQVADQVRVQKGDLGSVLTGQADLVIANIIADVILMLLPDLKRILKDDGEFLASGIIEHRSPDVEEGMREHGLEVIEKREDSGWVLLRARWQRHASL
ncbi:(LSU ribosomal protein L11P)-lysine N-methyltransferase [Desulfitobacterium dichloroeliminans LMG P-21439]|uniref:Ribosomal protein L11 methyltransferase n=1 Tax=Desulfitobacterium dichloroeliminans (strain LMG P-21439 / DCA1) TaxID=871963 RepID=L0FBL5_DESDL|nr:50S ribosomal protein L11 methyltransferase [Desulfitobacterium dichloroeliminans]AGA70415.1 (LSU ribosomal protein L11P)-lysine N-methyltransferase [Desulfitobacterium dichloroeliminans LMG P-21439]